MSINSEKSGQRIPVFAVLLPVVKSILINTQLAADVRNFFTLFMLIDGKANLGFGKSRLFNNSTVLI